MRTVIVTGGSRGIGLAIARKLRAAGYGVIAVARRTSEALEAALKEDAAPGALRFRAFDLAEVEGIAVLVRDIRDEVGPIYGLVNNAGIGTSGMLATMRDRDIEAILRLNALSPLVLAKHVLRSMMVAGAGGRIVNIASIVAETGASGLAAYSASKAALVGMTRALAREVGPLAITVNAVAPGVVATEMTQELSDARHAKIIARSALRRPVEADDVANAVEFLLSDKAKSITGTVLTVDAGGTV